MYKSDGCGPSLKREGLIGVDTIESNEFNQFVEQFQQLEQKLPFKQELIKQTDHFKVCQCPPGQKRCLEPIATSTGKRQDVIGRNSQFVNKFVKENLQKQKVQDKVTDMLNEISSHLMKGTISEIKVESLDKQNKNQSGEGETKNFAAQRRYRENKKFKLLELDQQVESLKAQVVEAQQLNEQLRQNNLALQGSMYVRTSHMNMLEVLRHENKEKVPQDPTSPTPSHAPPTPPQTTPHTTQLPSLLQNTNKNGSTVTSTTSTTTNTNTKACASAATKTSPKTPDMSVLKPRQGSSADGVGEGVEVFSDAINGKGQVHGCCRRGGRSSKGEGGKVKAGRSNDYKQALMTVKDFDLSYCRGLTLKQICDVYKSYMEDIANLLKSEQSDVHSNSQPSESAWQNTLQQVPRVTWDYSAKPQNIQDEIRAAMKNLADYLERTASCLPALIKQFGHCNIEKGRSDNSDTPTQEFWANVAEAILPQISQNQIEWLVRLRYVLLDNLAGTYTERRHVLGQLMQQLPTDVPSLGDIQIARLCVLASQTFDSLQESLRQEHNYHMHYFVFTMRNIMDYYLLAVVSVHSYPFYPDILQITRHLIRSHPRYAKLEESLQQGADDSMPKELLASEGRGGEAGPRPEKPSEILPHMANSKDPIQGAFNFAQLSLNSHQILSDPPSQPNTNTNTNTNAVATQPVHRRNPSSTTPPQDDDIPITTPTAITTSLAAQQHQRQQPQPAYQSMMDMPQPLPGGVGNGPSLQSSVGYGMVQTSLGLHTGVGMGHVGEWGVGGVNMGGINVPTYGGPDMFGMGGGGTMMPLPMSSSMHASMNGGMHTHAYAHAHARGMIGGNAPSAPGGGVHGGMHGGDFRKGLMGVSQHGAQESGLQQVQDMKRDAIVNGSCCNGGGGLDGVKGVGEQQFQGAGEWDLSIGGEVDSMKIEDFMDGWVDGGDLAGLIGGQLSSALC